jgi:glycosyltransferase involved in cell wall biosynthesis
MKKLLVLQGPVSSRSGYGDHTRDILKSLIDMDRFEIKVNDMRWGDCPRNGIEKKDEYLKKYFLSQSLNRQPDIFIQVSVPNEFNPVGKYNIGITAGMETTAVSAKWLEGLNRMNMTIVPSEHSKASLTASIYDAIDGRTRRKKGQLKAEGPIEVLFEGADTNVFNNKPKVSKELDEELSLIKEKFCFLFVGHWLTGGHGHDRKDVGKLIQTFCETFKNNPPSTRPALILKTSSATFSVIDRNQMVKRINKAIRKCKANNPPNIYLLHGDLTQDEMNYLYNHPKVKAHVSFTKGEGFGRPLLEASLSGKPVIASNWSGHVDFLKHSVMLPGELKKVDQSAVWKDVIIPESQWFYVNHIYAAKVMKDVFKNYKNYLSDAKKQAAFAAKNFSSTAMKEKFSEIMDKYIVEEVKVKLPKLKKSELKLPKLKRVEA